MCIMFQSKRGSIPIILFSICKHICDLSIGQSMDGSNPVDVDYNCWCFSKTSFLLYWNHATIILLWTCRIPKCNFVFHSGHVFKCICCCILYYCREFIVYNAQIMSEMPTILIWVIYSQISMIIKKNQKSGF